ncbi:MAG TPA: GLEYA domain-containing protein, partial [Verrucomicrobiae bacterium]|nr:GLEYA domain-containing protein [Verrucomicrobiae bacterium]
TVTAAALDASTKNVVLTTSAQTAGTAYTVNITKVADAQGNVVAAGSKATFTAWKLSSGWVTRELFFGTGTTVNDLLANQKFIDNTPDTVESIRQVAILTDLQVANYGARLSTYFVPAKTGAYEFYLYGDDDAQLLLSTDETAANLQQAITTTAGVTNFDAGTMFTSGSLTAGKRYLVQVLFQQGGGTASVALGARVAGSAGPLDQLPVLGGDAITTYINPDAGVVKFTQQPAPVSVAAFGRAQFSVAVTSPAGGLFFYQWQVNGVNIPGANRATYITPALATSDSGKKYRCIVSVNGSDTTSAEATLTVGPGSPSNLQPYIGIQFVGGSTDSSPGSPLGPAEVAGVVRQENFNPDIDGAVTDQPLWDAQGAPTPVTLTVDQASNHGGGTGTGSADRALFQGYIQNNNTPITLHLSHVPSGTYNLIVYSVGFNFNTTYEEDIALTGATDYPTFYIQAQHAGTYAANPSYARMGNTNPAGARDQGNYVQFDNVKPASDGSFTVTVTPQSLNVGNAGYLPAVNGLQLVKVQPVVAKPSLATSVQGANASITWGDSAAGFTLESSPVLGAGATWTAVSGVASPLAGAGSVAINAAANSQRFYRLRQ